MEHLSLPLFSWPSLGLPTIAPPGPKLWAQWLMGRVSPLGLSSGSQKPLLSPQAPAGLGSAASHFRTFFLVLIQEAQSSAWVGGTARLKGEGRDIIRRA